MRSSGGRYAAGAAVSQAGRDMQNYYAYRAQPHMTPYQPYVMPAGAGGAGDGGPISYVPYVRPWSKCGEITAEERVVRKLERLSMMNILLGRGTRETAGTG